MATETRFLFETDFDNPELLDSSARTYSEDELKAAQLEARQATLAELGNLEEKRAADLLAEMSAKLDALAQQRAQDQQSATEQAVDLAVAICQKVLPTLAAQHGLAEIEGHIARTLADVHGEPRVVVRVSEENIARLQPCIDNLAGGFEGEIVLIADDDLAATGCHVMWADGGNERDVQRTRAEIDKVVEQITALSAHQTTREPGAESEPATETTDTELLNNSNSLENTSQAID